MVRNSERGQSLIEVIVALAIGVLFITGATGVIMLTLRLDFQNTYAQSASELAQITTDEVATLANANWHNLRFDDSNNPIVHATSSPYHVVQIGNFLKLSPGATTTTAGQHDYAVSLTLTDLDRDTGGAIVPTGTGTTDPSTVQVDTNVSWQQNNTTGQVAFSRVLTRNRDRVFWQTDWVDGAAGEVGFSGHETNFATSTNLNYASSGMIFIQNLSSSTPVGTYSNIDPFDHYAWSDTIGWLDFRSTNTVYVTSTEVMGFATSSVGYIALNCDSVPPGFTNVCPGGSPGGPAQFGVSNDGSGNLSGFAWNDMIGWISFKDVDTSAVGYPRYQVYIDQATGDMHGFAWNDAIGWISFNSAETGSPVAYKVKVNSGEPVEATITSLIYDTGNASGTAPNAILWQGDQPAGTSVKFQVAVSNDPAGPWTFNGPTGTSDYFLTAGKDISSPIPHSPLFNNFRYLRYKAFLDSDNDRQVSPTVTDISLNWSL